MKQEPIIFPYLSAKERKELREQLTEALSNILLGEKIPLDVVNSETGEIIIGSTFQRVELLLHP